MATPPLLSLPLELHENILESVNFHDKLRLGMVNHYFASITPTYQDFLEAETSEWAAFKQLYTCKGCTRFRLSHQFANDMRKGRRSRRGTEADKRFCIQCGVERGWYVQGTEIAASEDRWILRRPCRTLTDRAVAPGATDLPSLGWTKVQQRKSPPYDDGHEDDWAHAMRSYGEDKHSEELYGVWPDT